MTEQRKAQRFDLRLPFELARVGPLGVTELGETKNISSGGVLLNSANELELGEAVEYTITLPTSNEVERLRLRCLGKVVRRNGSELAATLERYEFIRKDTAPRNGNHAE